MAQRIEEDFITSKDQAGMFTMKFAQPKLSKFDKS